MKLNRREGTYLTAIVLIWALTPLFLHLFLPRYEDYIGPIMAGGLLAGGVAVVVLLTSMARRLDRECQERLAKMGFHAFDMFPDLLSNWIPAEHRGRPGLTFDGFRSDANALARHGYECNRDSLKISLFGYSFGRGTGAAGHLIVMRLESPSWIWPELSCGVGSRWSAIHPIEGWERVQFEEDSKFSKSCWLQTPRPDRIRALFTPELRDLVLDHPEFRVFASGRALALYSDTFRLIPGEAEAFIEQARSLASCWINALQEVQR